MKDETCKLNKSSVRNVCGKFEQKVEKEENKNE